MRSPRKREYAPAEARTDNSKPGPGRGGEAAKPEGPKRDCGTPERKRIKTNKAVTYTDHRPVSRSTGALRVQLYRGRLHSP
eukprot:23896-Prymnesium_polylepis.1